MHTLSHHWLLIAGLFGLVLLLAGSGAFDAGGDSDGGDGGD